MCLRALVRTSMYGKGIHYITYRSGTKRGDQTVLSLRCDNHDELTMEFESEQFTTSFSDFIARIEQPRNIGNRIFNFISRHRGIVIADDMIDRWSLIDKTAS